MLRYNRETQNLQHELLDVQNQIAELIKRRRKLKKQIQLVGHKPVSRKTQKNYEKFFATTLQIYILELEDECWYVGQSRNVVKRFERHLAGKGANWTKIHKPLRVARTIKTESIDEQEVALLEDKITLEYAKKYGINYVRGGGYCQTKPCWPISLFK